jgi:mannose-6-phosphate isomerase
MQPFQLHVQYHPRVWGGQRLQATPANTTPIGEAWVIHEYNLVSSGEMAGQTLEQVAQQFGTELLGTNYSRKRFPLLIKLLNCADWLSIQVHPNDTQAVQLEGAGQLGKTEAWHLLEVDAGAELICGVKPEVSQTQLEIAIRDGTVRDIAQYQKVSSGQTVMMHAGTMHALGPGMLLYEVQQTSDITYRVYDWDRPASAGRALHIEQSVAVTTTGAASITPALKTGILTQCPYFTLEKIKNLETSTPNGSSFHAITITDGMAILESAGQIWELNRFESIIIPATSASYTLKGEFEALRSSVPEVANVLGL